MSQSVLHQILVGATAGDAITDHAIIIQKWLRDWGFRSNIFAQYIHPSVESHMRPFASYHPRRDEEIALFHHSIGDPMVNRVAALKPKLGLIYHNITPAQYFSDIDPAWAQRAKLGREQLKTLKPRVVLAMGVSDYNNQDLLEAGYDQVATLPLVVPAKTYDVPIDQQLEEKLKKKRPLLLFVGRLSPNKRQEDLLKLLHFFRQLQPNAHLALVGDKWALKYDRFLERLAENAGLKERLILPGHLSFQEMVTYFRCADLYVSMSEHEGFGKPFIEAMLLGVPVAAFASSAIPATMGDAGILFHEKQYPAIAHLCNQLLQDEAWRERTLTRQRQRAHAFQEEAIKEKFGDALAGIGIHPSTK